MQQGVWKFQHVFIHIQLGQIHLFIQHLNVLLQHCSGAEAAYKSLKKQGKLPEDEHTKFIAFGGDGGTYDIGIQSHYLVQWKEAMTWHMYAMIMEHT